MPNVPTVPGSEIDFATPPKAVHLDAQALSGPRMRGAAAMAGALDQVANFSDRVGEEIAKAREVGIAADIDLRMRTARQTFMDSLHNDSNEQEWVQRATETANATKEDIYAAHPDLPPRMRPHVEAALKGWQGSLETETNTLSEQQTITRAWGRVQQDYRASLDDDHPEHAATLLEQARSRKLTAPETIDQMERDIPKILATNAIHRGFYSDGANPYTTLQLIKSGASLPVVDQNGKNIVPSKVLAPSALEQLVAEGKARVNDWQKANYEEMLASSKDGYVDPELIRSKMATHEIDEIVGNNRIKSQDQAIRIQNEEDKRKAEDMAKELKKVDEIKKDQLSRMTHDPNAWGVDPEGYAHSLVNQASDISDYHLQTQAINDINQQLKSVKQKGVTADAPLVKQQLEFMNQAHKVRTETVPVMGKYVKGGAAKIAEMTQDQIDSEWSKGANREELIRRANAFVERNNAELNKHTKEFLDWVKANPDKANDTDALQKARMEIQRPEIQKRIDEAFRSKPSPTNAQDLAAWDWAMANSKDPRAQQIFQRLSK